MNVLFLTLVEFDCLEERNLYTDLLREFVGRGHFVYAISPIERKRGGKTHLSQNDARAKVLRLRIGNTQKTNLIEKGISTITLERLFIRAIKKYTSDIRFDLVLYSTPPVTLCNAVQFVKARDGAKTYLLLKDIFPQNSVDLGMLKKTGPRGVLYRMFRKKERTLYRISDYIGCMSPANARYVTRHNPISEHQEVEVNPNCICPECLRACAANSRMYFVIAGSGTQRHILQEYVRDEQPGHVRLLPQLSRDDYERFVKCCDVGLIFLDHRFTIPNFPSRLLSYLDAGLPVLAATDRHTDLRQAIRRGSFGCWCESVGTEDFVRCAETFLKEENRLGMGKHAREYLERHYTSERGYEIIMRHFV